MTYRGRVKDGVVVFEGQVSLPDGTEVNIEPVEQAAESPPTNRATLSQVLMRFAGKAKGLPPDASLNHDHYLYGVPKKTE